MIRVPPSDGCPCGSETPLERCCLQADNRLLPSPAVTATSTGSYSHPKCYAGELGGCSTKITGEHSITHALLKAFAVGKAIDIGGLRWMEHDERKQVPTSALVGNVLCSAHNGALSPLDAVAGRLVEWWKTTNDDMRTRRRRRPAAVSLFNGHDLERWLLKTLCGLAASGNADLHASIEPTTWRPPIEWLHMMFGTEPFPDRWGLYFLGRPGDRSVKAPAFSFAAISNGTNGLYGLAASIIEKRFVLALSAPLASSDSLISDAIFRPREFLSRNGLNESLTLLGWTGQLVANGVVIKHDNPRPGPNHAIERC